VARDGGSVPGRSGSAWVGKGTESVKGAGEQIRPMPGTLPAQDHAWPLRSAPRRRERAGSGALCAPKGRPPPSRRSIGAATTGSSQTRLAANWRKGKLRSPVSLDIVWLAMPAPPTATTSLLRRLPGSPSGRGLVRVVTPSSYRWRSPPSSPPELRFSRPSSNIRAGGKAQLSPRLADFIQL
jgi:hypothetical protein